jgi:hypothetical protein
MTVAKSPSLQTVPIIHPYNQPPPHRAQQRNPSIPPHDRCCSRVHMNRPRQHNINTRPLRLHLRRIARPLSRRNHLNLIILDTRVVRGGCSTFGTLRPSSSLSQRANELLEVLGLAFCRRCRCRCRCRCCCLFRLSRGV